MPRRWRSPRLSMDDRYPLPTPPVKVVKCTLAMNTPLWRVHSHKYAETEFNPGPGPGPGPSPSTGGARFSPIVNADGNNIPTLYAGVSVAAALMETVFHDVPFGLGLKSMPVSRFNGQVISCINPQRDLTLAKLYGPATRYYPDTHGGMTNCNSYHYSHTREWARAIHAADLVDGLIWMSRQHSDQMVLMLFGDRLRASELQITVPATAITSHTVAGKVIKTLAEEMGLILENLPASPSAS